MVMTMNGFDDPVGTGASPSPAGNVSYSDLMSMDFKVILNKSMATVLFQYLFYYFGIDEMVYSPLDTDFMLALKSSGVFVATDLGSAYLRQRFPQLVL